MKISINQLWNLQR